MKQLLKCCESLSNCTLAQPKGFNSKTLPCCESLSNCTLAQLLSSEYRFKKCCESLSNCTLAQLNGKFKKLGIVVNRFQIVL